MFSIFEKNKKINGADRSFVLCLDYVAISPFIYFNDKKESFSSHFQLEITVLFIFFLDCFWFEKVARQQELMSSV